MYLWLTCENWRAVKETYSQIFVRQSVSKCGIIGAYLSEGVGKSKSAFWWTCSSLPSVTTLRRTISRWEGLIRCSDLHFLALSGWTLEHLVRLLRKVRLNTPNLQAGKVPYLPDSNARPILTCRQFGQRNRKTYTSDSDVHTKLLGSGKTKLK